jgi:hypothetical protein
MLPATWFKLGPLHVTPEVLQDEREYDVPFTTIADRVIQRRTP